MRHDSLALMGKTKWRLRPCVRGAYIGVQDTARQCLASLLTLPDSRLGGEARAIIRELNPGRASTRYNLLYIKKLGGKSHWFAVGGSISREGTKIGRPGVGRGSGNPVPLH